MAEPEPEPADAGLRPRIGLALGPALLVVVLFLPPPEGLSPEGWRVLGLALLMATWWITEAVPIPATALVPIVLVPLLGLGTIQDATVPYADPVIFLLMGGMLIALAVERQGLHRRVALAILRAAGSSPAAIVGGVMVAAAFMSMWVSNTSTVLMMYPIALSVIPLVGEAERGFGPALMLGLGYATLIGGLGTLVATVPNALTAAYLRQAVGEGPSFLEWMQIGVPLILLLLPCAWFFLTRIVFRVSRRRIEGWRETLREQISSLGPMGRGERLVGIVFLLVATLWITQPLLSRIPGFVLDDTGIAMLGAVLLFLIPVDFRRGEFLIDWRTALRLPWGLLILFGGGLSLAGAIQRSGLAGWGAERLGGLGSLSLVLLVLVVAAVAVFASEIMSNTATAATLLPVAGALAAALGRDAWYLALPVGFAATAAFMMPVGTPSNAIVYGSGQFTLPTMARVGLVMNLVSVVAITIAVYVYVGFR